MRIIKKIFIVGHYQVLRRPIFQAVITNIIIHKKNSSSVRERGILNMQMFTAMFLKQSNKAWHRMPVHTNVPPDGAYQQHRLPFTNMLCVTRFLRVCFPTKALLEEKRRPKKRPYSKELTNESSIVLCNALGHGIYTYRLQGTNESPNEPVSSDIKYQKCIIFLLTQFIHALPI